MTSKLDTPGAPSGEARLKSRRSGFLRYVILSFAAALVVGMVSGLAAFLVDDQVMPGWVLIVGWIAAVVAMIWFTRDYFRRIDELDLLDNLWSSMIGLYFFIIAYGTWFVFDLAGMAGEPDSQALFVLTLTATFAAYGLRKLGWR